MKIEQVSMLMWCKAESGNVSASSLASGFLPPTMSYVTYDIIRQATRHCTSDVRHSVLYRNCKMMSCVYTI